MVKDNKIWNSRARGVESSLLRIKAVLKLYITSHVPTEGTWTGGVNTAFTFFALIL